MRLRDQDVMDPPRSPRLVRLNFVSSNGQLLGGPFDSGKLLTGTFKVKLAAEVRGACDVSVNVADFGVPDEREFRQALWQTAQRLLKGERVFAGCGYGIGRTGTFLAALVKLHTEVLRRIDLPAAEGDATEVDPVAMIRKLYYAGAVETAEQAAFVRDLDLTWMARRLAFKLNPLFVFDKAFWL